MKYKVLIILFTTLVSIGCSSPNRNSNILLKPPYDQIQYQAETQPTDKVIDAIEITSKGGVRANILNSLPSLYKKVLDTHQPTQEPIKISNINVIAFVKKEWVDRSYEICTPDTITLENKTITTQNCTTHYSSTLENVLYQKVTANVLE
jgi:hypothetical protein